MAVGYAHRADVVAFHQQQFNGDTAVARQPGGGGNDRHPILNRRGACGEEAVNSGNLDHAEPASTNATQPFQEAESRNVLSAGAGHIENRLALNGIDQLTIDTKRYFLLRQGETPPLYRHS